MIFFSRSDCGREETRARELGWIEEEARPGLVASVHAVGGKLPAFLGRSVWPTGHGVLI